MPDRFTIIQLMKSSTWPSQHFRSNRLLERLATAAEMAEKISTSRRSSLDTTSSILPRGLELGVKWHDILHTMRATVEARFRLLAKRRVIAGPHD
jgi:hypothetical protein